MILIFAHYYDKEAQWLQQHLSFPVAGPEVKLVIAEALGIAYTVSLSIKDNYNNSVIFFKDDMAEVSQEDVSLVINRLVYINPIAWNKSDEKEKTYAANEINAFFAAFIHSFTCPVINNIKHGSLFGNRLEVVKIIKTIMRAGIAIHPYVKAQDENSFPLMEENLPNCLRLMCWGNKIFSPTDQNDIGLTLKNKLFPFLQKQKLTAAYELFFLDGAPGALQLICISKSPALSVYGQPFLRYVSRTLNILQPCY